MQGVQSTIKANLLWGLTPGHGTQGQGIDNSPNFNGDPAGKPLDVKLTYDVLWDPSDPSTQDQIFAQLKDLKNFPNLYTSVTTNPLDTCGSSLSVCVEKFTFCCIQICVGTTPQKICNACRIRDYCDPKTPEDQAAFENEARSEFCGNLPDFDRPEDTRGIPTGNNFNWAVLHILMVRNLHVIFT